jgi:hypothetical protein
VTFTFTFYKIKISNTSAALEILNDREDIKWACRNGSSTNHGLMKNVYNFKIIGSRLKCSGYMIQSNVDNLNHISRPASRHFRNKKREYMKAKIHDLQTNSKNTNIRDLYRGINNFKKGYQPRIQ